MSKATLDYNSVDWDFYFQLSEDSPSGLLWKNSAKPKRNGKVAGCKNFNSRTKEPHMWRVNCQGKSWAVHRIIFIMLYGQLTDNLIIDHMDGNPFNNSISNLRVCHQVSNTQNRRKSSKNSTGFTGCSITSNGQGRTYVTAFVRYKNKQISERFNIEDLGYDKALEKAIEARKRLITELNKLGAAYTQRHGV